MIVKIKRQDCKEQYQIFPLQSFDYEKDEEEFFYPKVFKSYILTLSSKSFKGHGKALAIELNRLTKSLHIDALIFLGDVETPWLYQDNNFKPVRAAQQYLSEKKIGKRFHGALQVDRPELPTFIKHLAWLIRCNAALPIFHFIDDGQNILGNICQYGNLHLDTLNKQTDTLLKSFIGISKFELGDMNTCNNSFGKTSAIGGRQSVV